MVSGLSNDGYDVVTLVLSKVTPTSFTPDSKISHHSDLSNDREHAEETMTESSTDGETPKVEEIEKPTEDKPDESTTGGDAPAKATTGSLAQDNAIHFNEDRYVKASGENGIIRHPQCIKVNSIAYTPESMPAKYNTAYSVLQLQDCAEGQGVSQEEFNYARFVQSSGEYSDLALISC